MPTTPPLRPSQRFTALVHAQGWNDTTVSDLLADFLDSHSAAAEPFLAYITSRVAVDDEPEEEFDEPEPAEAGQSVDDLDARFGVQRASSGDLFGFDQVKDQPINHVWTITEGDSGSLWACPGFHVVNRWLHHHRASVGHWRGGLPVR